eukprot:1148775-Pelagomonas_calceolata.AAC.4
MAEIIGIGNKLAGSLCSCSIPPGFLTQRAASRLCPAPWLLSLLSAQLPLPCVEPVQGEVLGLRIRVAELEQQASPQQAHVSQPQGPAGRQRAMEHSRGPEAAEEAAREAKLLQGMVQALQAEAAQLRESHGMVCCSAGML